MNRVASIFLFLCLSSPFWLNYTLFQFRRSAIHQEVEEKVEAGVEQSEVVLLGFLRAETEEKLEWEHTREFRYLGQFYDVLEVRHENDSVFYLCYWDKEETRLSELFEKMLEDEFGREDQENDDSERLVELIKTPYRVSFFEWALTIPLDPAQAEKELLFLYQSNSESPLTPPPRV